jgi:hypothetical protein
VSRRVDWHIDIDVSSGSVESTFKVKQSKQRIFKYNQQDATLHNSFISAKRSTCYRRFLCPSSGAQKLYIQHLEFVKPLLLPFNAIEELESQIQTIFQEASNAV